MYNLLDILEDVQHYRVEEQLISKINNLLNINY